MARTNENQIADLLEDESHSECEIDSDDDVDNLIISSDSESDQEEFVTVESSNQLSLISSSRIVGYCLGKDKTTIRNKNHPHRNRRRLRSNTINNIISGRKKNCENCKQCF